MPDEKKKQNLRQVNQWQRTVARNYFIRYPDASISDVARATNVGVRTVARARLALVNEGLLKPGRNIEGPAAAQIAAVVDRLNAGPGTPSPAEVPDESGTEDGGSATEPEVQPEPEKRGPGRPKKGGQILDDEAIRKMAGMLDELADSDDVEETRKRMLKQTQRFVFDPTLHPDTRMSASQLWAKLVDMARAKDLGPGKPVTLEDAIARATDFLSACGIIVAVPAFYAAFPQLQDPEPASEGTPDARGATEPDLMDNAAMVVAQVQAIDPWVGQGVLPPQPQPPTAASPWA